MLKEILLKGNPSTRQKKFGITTRLRRGLSSFCFALSSCCVVRPNSIKMDIDTLIETGVSDDFLEQLLQENPKKITKWLEVNVTWPENLKKLGDPLADPIRFFEKLKGLELEMEQSLRQGRKCKEGFVVNNLRQDVVYCTKEGAPQGVVANILWTSLMLKKHEETGEGIAQALEKATKRMPGGQRVSKRMLSVEKRDSHEEVGRLPRWRADGCVQGPRATYIGICKGDGSQGSELIKPGGTADMWRDYHFSQSPMYRDKHGELNRNPYCIDEQTLIAWKILKPIDL